MQAGLISPTHWSKCPSAQSRGPKKLFYFINRIATNSIIEKNQKLCLTLMLYALHGITLSCTIIELSLYTVSLTDLDRFQQANFKSILTTLEESFIFKGCWGSSKNWLELLNRSTIVKHSLPVLVKHSVAVFVIIMFVVVVVVVVVFLQHFLHCCLLFEINGQKL